MRARNIKPKLFKNELLGKADPLLTILFEGLWCEADREGRLEDRPLRLCVEVFPYRRQVTEKRMDTMLQWLHEQGFIARYEVGSERFIQVLAFIKHQNPHKNERPSTIPALSPPEHSASTRAEPDEHSKSTLALGLNPSSLNSDSGILTPDSGYLNSDSGDSAVGTAVGEDARARARTRREEAPRGNATRRISGRLKNGNGADPDETRRKVLKALEGGLDAATISVSLHVPLEQVRTWQQEAAT